MYLLIDGKPMVEDNKDDFFEGDRTVESTPKPVELTRIVKTKTSIKCYEGEQLYCTFGGVQNWEAFTVQGGEFTEEVNQKELLLKELANLKLENKKKDLIAKNLMQQVAEIRLNIMKEGN